MPRYMTMAARDRTAAGMQGNRAKGTLRMRASVWASSVLPEPVGPISRQGNRVKESCGEEACEEVVVPGGGLASEAQ